MYCTENNPKNFCRGTEGDKVLHEAKTRLINIVKYQFSKILKELDDRDIHQYLRAFSFGNYFVECCLTGLM